MPLIIIGVVVFVVVAGVGVFLATSGPSDEGSGSTTAGSGGPGGPGGPDGPPGTGGDSSIDPSKWTYFGVRVGDLESKKHGVSGKVYAATAEVICLVDFNYDGAGSSAVFMVGATDDPDENGEVLRDLTLRLQRQEAENLRKYTSERVILKPSKPIKEYKYFSVYSKEEKTIYGVVKIENFNPPAKMDLGEFKKPSHDVKSERNTLLDSKRIQIKGFNIDGQAPATFFSVGTGKILKKNAIKIDEEELRELHGVDFELSLPEGKTWDQYNWFSAYCYNAEADLGHLELPSADAMTVPVYINDSSSQRRRAVHRRALLGNLSLKAESAHSVVDMHAAAALAVPGSFSDSSRRRKAVKRRARVGNLSFKAESGSPKLLACTFGDLGVKRSMVPSDGLCDVVFYTDVEYDSEKNTIASKDGGPAFSMLKSAARKYTKTTFGTSMSTGSIADAVQDKLSQLTASMDLLFCARFIHFGMLNVANIENYDTLKGADLRYLKVVADFLKKKLTHRQHHSALGISLRDGSKGGAILEAVKQAPHDFPGLTMIVLKLHTEDLTSSGGYWPVAPNPDGVDLSEHNTLSLASIKDEVKKHLLDIARHGRYAMLSFAMYARTYRMKASWSEGSVREVSESTHNMDYAAVCKMKAEKDSSDAGTMYAADLHKKFLALFDTPATCKAKTKARLRVMPKNFTGVVVYNVEMDDYKGSCGKGRFPLLKAIKHGLAA
ncbi:uncharacterized protein LOC144132685 isoform X2 [Amblyomma americanum]